MDKTYIAIDLKSFYASVECQELGKDPLTTNLVVADTSRTEKLSGTAVAPQPSWRGIPLSSWPTSPQPRGWPITWTTATAS